MFGHDLTEFLEQNVNFTHNKINQDIYYNIEDDKLWVHSYFGNESLHPDEARVNILIYRIHNTDDFAFACSFCDECPSSDYDSGEECDNWQECQAEMAYEYIHEHKFDDFGIADQIDDKCLCNVHYSELAELDLLLEETYGDYHRFLDKKFNNDLMLKYKDAVIDSILDFGIGEMDDGLLDDGCMHLYDKYCCDITKNQTLFKIGKSLYVNDIIGALEYAKTH